MQSKHYILCFAYESAKHKISCPCGKKEGNSLKIAGLQKLTLLDFPGKTACTIFVRGCNFRCPFCHNAGLVTQDCSEEISMDSLLAFLKKRIGLLDGVCVTGGEPLLQHDLLPFLQTVHAMGYAVKLDTNGSCPDKLRSAVESGCVDMVAMDIKNSPEKYAVTAGTERIRMDEIHESVRFLLQDTVPYEFRTTVVKDFHTDADFHRIGQWIRGAKAYYLQAFRDSGHLIQPDLTGCSDAEMQRFLQIVRSYVPQAALRGIDPIN